MRTMSCIVMTQGGFAGDTPPPDDGLFRYSVQRANRIDSAKQQLQQFYSAAAATRRPMDADQVPGWMQASSGRQLEDPETPAAPSQLAPSAAFAFPENGGPGRPAPAGYRTIVGVTAPPADVDMPADGSMDQPESVPEPGGNPDDCPAANPRIPRMEALAAPKN